MFAAVLIATIGEGSPHGSIWRDGDIDELAVGSTAPRHTHPVERIFRVVYRCGVEQWIVRQSFGRHHHVTVVMALPKLGLLLRPHEGRRQVSGRGHVECYEGGDLDARWSDHQRLAPGLAAVLRHR